MNICNLLATKKKINDFKTFFLNPSENKNEDF